MNLSLAVCFCLWCLAVTSFTTFDSTSRSLQSKFLPLKQIILAEKLTSTNHHQSSSGSNSDLNYTHAAPWRLKEQSAKLFGGFGGDTTVYTDKDVAQDINVKYKIRKAEIFIKED